MENSDIGQTIVVQLDGDLGREIIGQFRRDEVRMAPSVRGVDLAQDTTVILLAIGGAADIVTLILAKDHAATFCHRLAALIRRGRAEKDTASLKVEVRSASRRLTVDLETSEDEALSEALLVLARITQSDPMPTRGINKTSAPNSPTNAVE